MFDFLGSDQLKQLSDFLTEGSPSLLVQLLAINTIMFVFFIYRRISIPNFSKRHVTYTTQWILVAANFAVILQGQWLPFLSENSVLLVNSLSEATKTY